MLRSGFTFTVFSTTVLPSWLTFTVCEPALTSKGPATLVAATPSATDLPSISTSTVRFGSPCTTKISVLSAAWLGVAKKAPASSTDSPIAPNPTLRPIIPTL